MSPVMLTITFVFTVEFESGVEVPFATKTSGYCLCEAETLLHQKLKARINVAKMVHGGFTERMSLY